MSDEKMSLFTTVTSLLGTEFVPLIITGDNEKITIANLLAYIIANIPDPVVSGNGYYQYKAASLEPDAIEPILFNNFTYSVASGATKLLMASFFTKIGSSSTGRMEQRNPQHFFPMRNMILAGPSSLSTAMVIDPTLPVYANPRTTYYSRLQKLMELDTKTLSFDTANQRLPFLTGAYGAIILQYTCYHFAWLCVRPLGGLNAGLNLFNEIEDTTVQSTGVGLCIPFNKRSACEIHSSIISSTVGGIPGGSVSYVLLPSDWSVIPDTNTYLFRDDFMGASLNTGIWTRVQSVTGNVEIDTNYQWCKLKGSTSWGTNGLFRTAMQSIVVGQKFIVDYYVPNNAVTSSDGAGIAGWTDGLGQAQSNFVHGLNFASSNIINVYENGVNRGTVASYTEGAIYRIRITLTSTGAKYEMQGGIGFPSIGSNLWTDVTPSITSSPTSSLTVGASAWANESYISDMKVI